MPAVAQAAAATTISIDKLNTGVTYVQIGQVTNISGVDGGETGKADTTHLSSTRKTSRPTIRGETEVTFDLHFDPSDTDHQYIRDLRVTGAIHGWQVAYPQVTGAPKATFHAWVSNFDGVHAAGIDENLAATVTLTVTDDFVWTP